jgi:predicted  nucleic acid-binding Zn-ribbon protein
MNPIKALCTLLNRFIVEHGSADVQTKHIAFLKEQLELLKGQLVTCNQKMSDLANEKKHLEMENAELKTKIEKLSQKSKIGSPHIFTPMDPELEKIKGRSISIEK